MKSVSMLFAAAMMVAGTAGTGFAVMSSDGARVANAQNAEQPANPPAVSDATRQNEQSGVTTGPGSPNHDAGKPLGYAKGAGENSSVGKGE
jgi:hypothetical protein